MPTPRRIEKTAEEIAEAVATATGLDASVIVVTGKGANWTAAVVGGLGTPSQQDEFARIANALSARYALREE